MRRAAKAMPEMNPTIYFIAVSFQAGVAAAAFGRPVVPSVFRDGHRPGRELACRSNKHRCSHNHMTDKYVDAFLYSFLVQDKTISTP